MSLFSASRRAAAILLVATFLQAPLTAQQVDVWSRPIQTERTRTHDFIHYQVRLTFDLDNTLWSVRQAIGNAERHMRAWLDTEVPGFNDQFRREDLLRTRELLLPQYPEIRHDLTQMRQRADEFIDLSEEVGDDDDQAAPFQLCGQVVQDLRQAGLFSGFRLDKYFQERRQMTLRRSGRQRVTDFRIESGQTD